MQLQGDSKKTLDIQTFGTFSATVGGVSVTDTSARSGKIWTLFKYIITHRDNPVPTERLIEILWQDDPVEKPINALFTLVYRLRNLLNAPFEQKQNFIIFHHDCYIWNQDAPYTLDAEQFERAVSALETEEGDHDERFRDGLAAFDLYTGSYLPELPDEWVVPVRYNFKRLYATLVPKLAEFYSDAEDYDSVIKLAERAISLDPYEEPHHILLINTLLKLGQTSQAMGHFDYVAYRLQKDIGVQPSGAFLELRKSMYPQSDTRQDLLTIRESLSEPENLLPGAFFCDLEAFRHIFRLEDRMVRRASHFTFLVELAVTTAESGSRSAGRDPAQTENTLTEAMSGLRRTALFTLRRNDVITQYSQSQLLLLLQSSSPESCEDVIKRITDRFLAEYAGKLNCAVRHTILQI